MKIERYIFKEVLSPSLVGLLLYSFVLMMNHFFLLAREAIQKEIPFFLVLKLLSLEFPKIMVLTIPMSILFGILIGLGRLVSDSEIVALHASGISQKKIFKSAVFLSILATLISLFIYLYFVPSAEFAIRKTRNEIFLKSDIAKDIKNKVFYDRIEGFTIYSDEIKAGTKLMERVFIKQAEKKGEPERLTLAEKGIIMKDPTSGIVQLHLENGETHLLAQKEPDIYRINKFSHLTITLENVQEMFKLFANPLQKGIQDQTLKELSNELSQAKMSPADPASQFRIRRVKAEIHQRLAIPFVSIAFCIVAFPLAMMNIRGGKGGGFALNILFIIIFWVVFVIGRDLALDEKIPVWLGIWSGNITMLIIGILCYLLNKAGIREKLKLGIFRVPFHAGAAFFRHFKSKAKRIGLPNHGRAITVGRKAGYFLNLIDRYIIITFLKIFLFIGLTIYVISLIVELKSIMDSVVERNLPFHIIFTYFKYYTPGLMKYIIPIASMMSAVITIALLSKYSEVTAITASGISIYRMIVPIVIITFLFSTLFYLMQDYILPYTNQRALMVKDTIEGRKGISYSMIHGRWVYGKNKIFHYRNYESDPPMLIGVSIFEISQKDFTLKGRSYADKCVWNGKEWDLKNGWKRTFDNEIYYKQFEQMTISLEEGLEYFETREKSFFGGSKIPEQMSFFELKDYISSMQSAGYDTTNLRVGMHEKLSFPLTALIMVIISLPFAFLMGKKGSLYGVGIALLIIIVYWAVFAISNALGLEGILPPFLSAWAPNIIFGLAGIWGIFNIRT